MNRSKTPIRIAIADSHVMFRQAITETIEHTKDIEVVLQANDGKDLSEKLEHAKILPDVCIIDVSMPKENGWRVLQQLSNKWQFIRFIIVTSLQGASVAKTVFKYGGQGYVCKNSSIQELQLAIQKVYKNEVYIPNNVHGHSCISTLSNNKTILNNQEMQFLEYCCEEYTYKEIGEKMFLSQRTVEAYRDTLLSKLNIRSRTGLVVYAIRNGIVPLQD